MAASATGSVPFNTNSSENEELFQKEEKKWEVSELRDRSCS